MSTTFRRVRLVFAAAALTLCGNFTAVAGPVANLVEDQRSQGAWFDRVSPFSAGLDVATAPSRTAADARRMVRDGLMLSLDADALRSLRRDQPETMALDLPIQGGSLVLDLVRVNPFAPGFKVVTSDGKTVPVNDLGLHYRGVVRAEADSLVSISVFRNEILGFVRSPGHGYLTIGRLGGENPRNQHLVFAEAARVNNPDWSCETKATDFADATANEMLSYFDAANGSGLDHIFAAASQPVRIYVEADNDIYKAFGSSVANVTNYLNGLFAQSATLYGNESIPITLSQLFIWDRRSPYKGNSSSQLLASFQKNRTSFNGDIGHLVALRGGGGIAAGFNAFCSTRTRDKQAFSMIDTTYANLYNYSWSVMVFTHEMGHLMGSRHTHACVWNGNNTQIDGCYTPEGSCSQQPYPSGGGTIMSYCHLSGRPGINFNNGFGPQPGNAIRSMYNSCHP